jgi:DUF3068 family protein
VRRVIAYVFVTIGFLLICLGPMMRLYTTPRVEKAPLDVYDKTDAIGAGRYFDQEILQVVGPHDLRNTSVYRGDVEAGTRSVAVYDHFESTKDLVTGKLIDILRSRVAMDRVTGEAVNCCGAERQQGHTLKLPFHTQRRTYQFWDGTLKKAAPLKYVRDDMVAGLDVYVFRQDVPSTAIETIEIPGSLADRPEDESVQATMYYAAQTLIWVEPRTGAVISGSQHASRWLADGDRFLFPVADTNLRLDGPSVEHTASRIRSQITQLQLARDWIPLFGPILGVVLLALGLVFLLREPSNRSETALFNRQEKVAAS